MNHQEVEQKEIIERYVLHQLVADERLAFQEHYFACEECFEQVQSMARFVAGVRDESRSGGLAPAPLRARAAGLSSSWLGWFKPALAVSVAASLLLAGTVLWLWLWKVPGLREEIARQEQARQDSEKSLAATRNRSDEAERQLEIERTERAKLEQALHARSYAPDNQQPGPDVVAQANIPTVTLEATRDSQGSAGRLTIPSNAKKATLLMQVGPGIKARSFRVQILTSNGRVIETVTKAGLNRDDVLKVSVPVKSLQSQSYLVRLYAVQEAETRLLGEYVLAVHKE